MMMTTTTPHATTDPLAAVLAPLRSQGFFVEHQLSGATDGAPQLGATAAVMGPARGGKTTVALHLASALCRVELRGVVLYLTSAESLHTVWSLLLSNANFAFGWVGAGASTEPPPARGATLLLQALEAEGPTLPVIAGLPPELGGRGVVVLAQILSIHRRLPPEAPLRVVVLDSIAGLEDAGAALVERLRELGVSVVLVGEAPAPVGVLHRFAVSRVETGGAAAAHRWLRTAVVERETRTLHTAMDLDGSMEEERARWRTLPPRPERRARDLSPKAIVRPLAAVTPAVSVTPESSATPPAAPRSEPGPLAPRPAIGVQALPPWMSGVVPAFDAPAWMRDMENGPAEAEATPRALVATSSASIVDAARSSNAESAPATRALGTTQPGSDARLLLPTGITGLDRLLDGGLRLCARSSLDSAPATTIAISGECGAGKTFLALHLAAALCRAQGRGVALYLSGVLSVQEVRARLRGRPGSGFAWVHGEGPPPVSADIGLWLEVAQSPISEYQRPIDLVPPASAETPSMALADGSALRLPAPSAPWSQAPSWTPRAARAPWALWSERAQQLFGQILRARQRLDEGAPLRVVVLDDLLENGDGSAAEGLMQRLLHAGISVILVGEAAIRGDHCFVLTRDDPAVGGRALRILKTALSTSQPGPHLLVLRESGPCVLPTPALLPRLSVPPSPALRRLPAGRFGDTTIDQRAGDRPWLTPQSRILLYGPDPTCGMLLANRFLSEAPQRLALFFPASALRDTDTSDDADRGIHYIQRRQSGAELLGDVAEALARARARWPEGLRVPPRVAIIDPGSLHGDGRHGSEPAVLDAALLSLCMEAGATVLLFRTTDQLPAWWSDFDLVLHVPAPTERERLKVRVVVDRVLAARA